MGATFKFDCQSCSYSATVSGGKDYGLLSVVRTMVCLDCDELVDVLVGHYGLEGKSGSKELDAGMNTCFECKSMNLKRWSPTLMPCPKCHEAMTRGDIVELWD